jgi:hypothetical protein
LVHAQARLNIFSKFTRSQQSDLQVIVLHSQGFQGWRIAKYDNEVLVQGFGATNGSIEDVAFTILTLI